MDHPSLFLPSTPRFVPKSQTHTPSRSPTRPRLVDDILSDLSPSTTLEAFTSRSGSLSASIESASTTQRAFGIRAAVASKKIQEWTIELSAWSWPSNRSEGFDVPALKRRGISHNEHDKNQVESGREFVQDGRFLENEEYWGSLPAHDVLRYESRIEEISEDMEDLNVEEIKSQVLNTHISQTSPTPSSTGSYVEALSSQAYTRIDDFTAVVTATVLQALPSLSRLMALMDVWSVRIAVLRQVSPLIALMDDAEVALRSGWKTIQTQQHKPLSSNSPSPTSLLSRQDYEIMRDVLQGKVSKLGQKIDYMLDTLEGRNDTLPETWLDRMETIEQDYGEWVVCAERKVRDGEWQNEISKRREEQLHSPQPFASEKFPPSLNEGKSVREDQSSTNKDGLIAQAPENARETQNEATLLKHNALQQSSAFGGSASKAIENNSDLALFDGQRDENSTKLNPKDVPSAEGGMQQSKEPAALTNNIVLLESVMVPSHKPDVLSSASLGVHNETDRQEKVLSDISPHLGFVSDKVESKVEAKKSINLPSPVTTTLPSFPALNENQHLTIHTEAMKPLTPEDARLILTSDELPIPEERPSTPVKTSASAKNSPSAVMRASEPLVDEKHSEISSTTLSSKIPRFGHPLANSLRRELHPEAMSSNYIFPYSSPVDSTATITTDLAETSQVVLPQSYQTQRIVKPGAQEKMLDPDMPIFSADHPESVCMKSMPGSVSDSKPVHIDLPAAPLEINPEIKSLNHLSPGINPSTSTKGHKRGPSSVSMISGYATSEPSPIIYEAEPTEYFRPDSPPIIAKLPELSTVTTPVRTSHDNAPESPKIPEGEISPKSRIITTQEASPSEQKSNDSTREQKDEFDQRKNLTRRRPVSNDSATSVIRTVLPHGRTSQDGSTTSEASTINERLNSITSTPTRIESPEAEIIPRSWHSQFVSDYDGDSPSLGRVRLYNEVGDFSPEDSPLPATPSLERYPLQLHRAPSFDTDSIYSESPSTPGQPSVMSNVEISPTPGLPSPSKHSDDQLQQQISEILESIPARIRLTSEPDTSGTSDIKQVKKRISLNPFSRPSSRAATPSFTLAPAYAKNPRPRPQNGNPEIKLYHLSRSTGEAPIKLFVRLVGEKGERVMVRVGGGWADLGEYLKEYASHHGRRSDQPGKVEIQDLPPRVVSTSSSTSTTTLRNGTWNTSEASSPLSRPGSRPASALGRPLSSLAIRKTRKSVGEEARESTYRSPSTPLSPSFRSSPSEFGSNDTPSSVNSARSVSQMSWREEESSLGLAGPRSRKGEISAENAAWVESMKEKVRIASVEKDKKDKASFGEIGQVGATKRLFKKSR